MDEVRSSHVREAFAPYGIAAAVVLGTVGVTLAPTVMTGLARVACESQDVYDLDEVSGQVDHVAKARYNPRTGRCITSPAQIFDR
ncbi:hypothetical protein [Plantibacter sp. YIM 135347]|uniref:hypothetical protein n=1 Tax=Plantibacter sp. YIM 135347 TaxID=3423919 RepID=UPI003D3574EB